MDHQASELSGAVVPQPSEPNGAVAAQPPELSAAAVTQPSPVPAPLESPAGWSTDTSYWHSRKFSEKYRSASKRARVASAALGVVGVVVGVTVFHDLAGFGVIRNATLGLLTPADATAFDDMSHLLATIYALTWIVTGVAFLAWLSRTVDNIPSLGGGVPRDTPRWSIAWWFIPFANLVKPFLVVRDVGKRLASPSVGAAMGLTLAWWLCMMGGDIVTFAAAVVPYETLDELRTAVTLHAIADGLVLLAAVLAILVVRHIQRQATARAAALVGRPDAAAGTVA